MAELILPQDEFKNVGTELSMTVDTPYRFMNAGSTDMIIVFLNTEPASGASEFIYPPHTPLNSATLVYDGTEGIWAKSTRADGKIVIKEVV
jgi:hypothetical protein